MAKPKVIMDIGGESREMDCPMSAVQIIAEIIAEHWDEDQAIITITVT